MRDDFEQAEVNLKAKVSYSNIRNIDPMFNKDEYGNISEDWTFFINKQDDETTNAVWMTLVRWDKDKKNITQIDFDDISRKELGRYIQGLHKIYKLMDKE